MPPAYAPARPFYNLSNAYGLAGPAGSVIYDAKGNRQGGYMGYGPTVTRPNPRLTNQILELLRGASAAGPVHFIPFHGLTAETPEQRRDYRHMLRNPYLKAAVITNVLQVASLPYQVQPSKWGGPFAEESAANIDWTLENVEGGFAEVVWDVLIGGMLAGHSVTEPRYALAKQGPQQGYVITDTFKARDDLTYRLDVDAYLNITALQAVTFNYGEFFDPTDFVIFTHNKIYDNPLGMSDLRSVWAAVRGFDMITRLELIGLDKFALPFVKATYSAAEHRASLEEALATARDNGYLLVPQGTEVEMLNLLSAGSLDAFDKAKESKAKEIAIGISGAYLHMLTSGTPNDRGDSGVQKSTSELIPWWLSQRVCNALNHQWVPRQCKWNYGLDCARPRITMGGVNVTEMLNDLELDRGLLGLGVDLSVEERRAYYGRTAPADPQDSLIARKALVSMIGTQPPGGDNGPGDGGGNGNGGDGSGGGGGSDTGGTGLAFADGRDPDGPLDFADYQESKHPRGQPKNRGQFASAPGHARAAATHTRLPPLQGPSKKPTTYLPAGSGRQPTKDLPASLRGTAKAADPLAGVTAALEAQFGKGSVADISKGLLPSHYEKPTAPAPAPKTREQVLRDVIGQNRRDLANLEGSRDQEASFDRARLQHEIALAEAELSGKEPPPRLGEETPALGEPTPEERQAAADEMATAAEALTTLAKQLKAAGVAPGHGPALAAAQARLSEAADKLSAVLSRVRLTEREPLPFADDADGHWITIGGTKGADGKRHGGSPVFIRNGRIEKGAPGLAGRHVGNLKEEPKGRKAQQAAADSGWASEAKKSGVHPDDLHTLAGEIQEHDKHLTDERAEVVRQAHRRSREKGFTDLRAAALNEYHGRGDADALRGLDEIATDLAAAYPHHFAGHHDPVQRLHDMVLEGVPKRMSRDDAYRQALEHLAAHGPHERGRQHRVSEEPIPFADYDEAKHPRGQPKNKGQFGHSPGGGAAKGSKGKGGGQAPAGPVGGPALAALMEAEFGGREQKAPAGGASAPAKGKKKFEKSKAKVKISDYGDPDVIEELRESLISYQKLEDIPSLVGAPDDAEVTLVQGKNGQSLWITVEHKAYTAKRYIKATDDGRVFMHNDEFWMKPEFQKSGLGTEIFARQVQFCQDAGLDYIECHAAQENPRNRAKPHNGYYTWPRLGYDMSLTDSDGIGDGDEKVYAAARAAFPDAETVLDVMETKEGRDWWKANGTDMLEAKFDLSEGSRSMRVMEAYLNEREQAKKAPAMAFGDPEGGDGPTGREEIVLNDDEEEALERAWERLGGRPDDA